MKDAAEYLSGAKMFHNIQKLFKCLCISKDIPFIYASIKMLKYKVIKRTGTYLEMYLSLSVLSTSKFKTTSLYKGRMTNHIKLNAPCLTSC